MIFKFFKFYCKNYIIQPTGCNLVLIKYLSLSLESLRLDQLGYDRGVELRGAREGVGERGGLEYCVEMG